MKAPSVVAVAEINVTPLVDVLLVLLIIFMIVVPLAAHGIDAAMPPPSAESRPSPAPVLVVSLDGDGLALNRQAVTSLAELAGRLADALAVRSDRTVFVQAAGDVTYGSVVEVMDVAKGAGAQRIGIMNASAP